MSGNGGGVYEGSGAAITPALIMQMIYYEQLSALDEFFGLTYDSMLSRYRDKVSNLSTSLAREFQNTNSGKMIEMQSKAPDERSEYVKKMPELRSELNTYHFQNKEGEPLLLVFTETDVKQEILLEQFKHMDFSNNNNFSKNFEMKSGVLLENKNGQYRLIESDKANLGKMNSYGIVNNDFAITPGENEEVLVFSSELHTSLEKNNQNELTENDLESVFENSLVAFGNSKQQIEKREIVDESIEFSDILVGYNNDFQNNSFVPFYISHTSEIPKNKNLQIYYEAYNFAAHESDPANIEITYRVQKNRNGLFSIFGKKDTQTSVTIFKNLNGKILEELLEIETNDLKAGDYSLQVTVMDNQNDISATFDKPFKISD
jgi:hypothetical protein